MKFFVIYHEAVLEDDIPKLDEKNKNKIRIAIEKKLFFKPEVFGKHLRRSIKNYRKLRVGDYRVIFRIEKNKVKIFAIQHRSIVYKQIKKRID